MVQRLSRFRRCEQRWRPSGRRKCWRSWGSTPPRCRSSGTPTFSTALRPHQAKTPTSCVRSMSVRASPSRIRSRLPSRVLHCRRCHSGRDVVNDSRPPGEKTMKVLLTGGSGNLGQVLVPRLLEKGDQPVILDVRAPASWNEGAVFIEGSVLDRSKLTDIFRGCGCIVHIAAWHGIHEDRGEKDAYDFFDLNVRGTFEVFEAAACAGIVKVIFISTTSVYRPDTRYGSSKILAERIAEDYRKHRLINVVTLRPRGFIPYWDNAVYAKYSDWARWFWKGAVHIDDVASAVMLSLDLLSRRQIDQQLVLTLDSAYEYTGDDFAHWDAEGPGSTFRKKLSRILRLGALLRARSGIKADPARYFRDGSLARLPGGL